MKKVICSLFVLFPLSSYSFGAQLAELETETTKELLLFYDWEELLVEAPTRRPTKMQDVAENISIITAEEIRVMNAHSVNEILRTVTGVNAGNRSGNFGERGNPNIHASDYVHVLLLLDGVRLNDVDAGYPETGGIPVQIIDRIEVVKGPASSAWGSALGGVINIVTKQAGNEGRPTGTIYGSYGEEASQDYRADAAGELGNFRYYLYGGYMDSDGLDDDKYFENKSFYGKLVSALTEDVSLTFTAGYWYPDFKLFDFPEYDLNYMADIENYLITGKLDAVLSPKLRLNFDLYFRSQEWRNQSESLATGEFLDGQIWDNNLYGGSAHLTWVEDNHTMLLGAELSRGENDRTWLDASAPTISWGTEKRNDWALYFNDTIKWEKLTLTPGLRYDHLSIAGASSDDILSPSLGATYKITDDTLFRATAARGFIRPPISQVVGGPGFAGNPDLKPEDLWSLQAGIESTHITNTHLKADVFYHWQDDTWYWNDDLGLYVNGGVSERTGVELNATVNPFEHFTSGLGVTYIWVEPYQGKNDETYGLNVKLNYNTERFGSLALFGNYFWWHEGLAHYTGSYDDMIWDLHYNKDIFTHEGSPTTVNVFFSLRNLFNGAQYSDELFINPDRWFEAGLRIHF